MTTTSGTRKTADERREEILAAAREEFSRHGLHGASTDAIARRAGISQPYLFRLFGTKKELFLEGARRCLAQTYAAFDQAADGLQGEEAVHAMGEAYGALISENPDLLRAQMQGYAAAADPEVREVIRRGFGRLVEAAERLSGQPPEVVSRFFATGMLLNVLAMMGVLADPAPWTERLVAGCGKQ
jgi:AcrR family transcriptional regulator